MNVPRGLLLALLLSTSGFLVAQEAEQPLFNLTATPLSSLHYGLLTRNKYEFRSDGTVLDPSGKAVGRSDMGFLLHRLESSQRLRALLQINIILNKSAGEKNLAAEEKRAIREILRSNWPVLTLTTRRQFKGYFSLQELEGLDVTPAPSSLGVTSLDMKDPEDLSATKETVAAPAAAAAAAPAAVPEPPTSVVPAPEPAPVVAAPAPAGTPDIAVLATPAIEPPAAKPPELPGGPQEPAPTLPVAQAVPEVVPSGGGTVDQSAVQPPPAPVAVVSAPAAPAAVPEPAPVIAQAMPNYPRLVTDNVFPSLLMPLHTKLPPVAAPVLPPAPQPPAPPPAVAAPAIVPAGPAPVPYVQPAYLKLAPPQSIQTPGAAENAAPAIGQLQPWSPGQPIAPLVLPPPAPVNAPTPPAAFEAPKEAPPNTEAMPPVATPTPEPPPVPIPEPAPAAVLPPAPPAAPQPLLTAPTAAQFEKFLVDAPYGREAKALLKLISERAPDPARARALATIVFALPQIVLDSARTGEAARSRLIVRQAEGRQEALIVLNTGAVLFGRRKLFLGETKTLLPESSKAFDEAGLPAPALLAYGRENPSQEEKGAWGTEKVFSDGSRRVAFSPEAQAGALLAELLRLDARLRGQDVSPWNTELFARTGQWLLYAKLEVVLGHHRFLDPELRLSFRQWLDNPSEQRDHLLHTLSSARSGLVDPRTAGTETHAQFIRQALSDCPKAEAEAQTDAADAYRQGALAGLQAYEDTGLFDGSAVKAARARAEQAPLEPGRCQRWERELAGLPKSSAMLSEMMDAERRFRREREDHAAMP